MTDHDPPLTSAQRSTFAAVLATILVVALLASALLGCGPRTPDLPVTTRPVAVSLLQVNTDDGGGQCTIWEAVGPSGRTFLVTAGHCCVEDAVLVPAGANAVPGAEVAVLHDDDEHDVCVLRGDLRGDSIALAMRDPEVGEMVWTAGYPLGYPLISVGIWSGRDDDNEGIASTAVGGGASGSPMMDARGRAIGVVVKRVPRMGDNLTIVAPLEWLRHGLLLADLASR